LSKAVPWLSPEKAGLPTRQTPDSIRFYRSTENPGTPDSVEMTRIACDAHLLTVSFSPRVKVDLHAELASELKIRPEGS
jgi:hypothetical protein